MEWLKKHGDTLAVIAVFAGGFWLLNEKMETRFNEVDRRFSGLEKEMAIVKKNIFSS